MKKQTITNQSFKFLYLLFGCLFFLLCGAITAIVFSGYSVSVLVPLLLAAILLLGILFVLCLKQMVLQLFDEIDSIMDNAIAGNPVQVKNEETELSLFTAKLQKFIAMRDRGSREAGRKKAQTESLIADISHQTKTPVANILLYSELLTEKAADYQELTPLIHRISAQSQKLKWLIQSLVHMSRLENGIIHCDITRRNLSDMLVQAVNSAYGSATQKNITITLECDPRLDALFDAKWTLEAVSNLMENAVKYTPEGGLVRLSATPYELFMRIDVADNGIGIPPEELSQIFGRFYRSAAVSQEEGIGIGLYLSREIISAQNGYMKVSSKPGEGSIFSVFLPM